MGIESRADGCRGRHGPQGKHLRAAGSVVAVMNGDAWRPFRSAPQGDRIDATADVRERIEPLVWRGGRHPVERKPLTQANNVVFRPSVARVDAGGDVPNRSDERVVAMCRCPEWPQAVSGCL
jgi:hypothetical protein